MCTAYFLFVKKSSEDEVTPGFLQNKKCEITPDKKTTCSFMTLPSIRRDTWDGLKRDIQTNYNISFSSFVVFAHDLSQYPKMIEDVLGDTYTLYIDYSGGDPSYLPMWEKIRSAKDIDELIRTLEYWKRTYAVDPLRRIKHRAINLFMPLSTDIQFLFEIWRRKDLVMAKTHLAELKTEWENKISPITYLYRLWYMLLREDLNWGRKGLPAIPSDVSLPKDEHGKELSLYEWLKKYHIKEFSEWQKLLKLVQIDPVKRKGKFNVTGGNGVHSFFKMLKKETKHLEKIVPGKEVKGFFTDKTIQDEFGKFLKWLNDLNDAFEDVVKKCQRES